MSTPSILGPRRTHFPLGLRRRIRILIGILLLFVAMPGAWAQQQCNLQMTIMDIDGNRLPEAQIVVRFDGRELSRATANDQGIAVVSKIPSATYEVLIEKAGFHSSRQRIFVDTRGTAVEIILFPKLTKSEQVEVRADVDGAGEDHVSASQSLQREEVKSLPVRPATVFSFLFLRQSDFWLRFCFRRRLRVLIPFNRGDIRRHGTRSSETVLLGERMQIRLVARKDSYVVGCRALSHAALRAYGYEGRNLLLVVGSPALWPTLVRGLQDANREMLSVIEIGSAGRDSDSERRSVDEIAGPTVCTIVVANCKLPDGQVVPQIFITELDWRQYALLQRLHLLDHRTQIRKLLGASDRWNAVFSSASPSTPSFRC